jgi:hypothetical protein
MDIVTPALTHEEAPPEDKGELPPMEDLVKRIPAPARAAMDEFLRAQFVTVKRFPAHCLKS